MSIPNARFPHRSLVRSFIRSAIKTFYRNLP